MLLAGSKTGLEPRQSRAARTGFAWPELICSSFVTMYPFPITPASEFYIRHHHPVPLMSEKEVEDFTKGLK